MPYLIVLLGAGLLVYSQTQAFAWDEGFHLLAAQSILAGKRPYLDFVFSQTPLNAYWNAAWMRIFGDTWRTAHAAAALSTTAAVWMAADFVLRRFPEARWRTAVALAVAALAGLNVQVVEFGGIGQAYGLCLLLTVAAFRLTVLSLEREGVLLPAAAGLFAGAAADSSLLTAPAAAVLFAWLAFHGRRATKCAGFAAGMLAGFAPLIALFARAPRNAVFGVLEYNLRYRGVQWETATGHNLGVYLSWIDSSHALVLAALAAAGLFFVLRRSAWDRNARQPFLLCGWLALALGLHISTARPTFERYYLLLVPFLAIPASAGLYWIATSLYHVRRPWVAAAALALFLGLGLARSLYEDRDDFTWPDFEEIARKTAEVAPRGAPLLADEGVYFMDRISPPSGMELADSHKLELAPEDASRFHIVSGSELTRRIRAGEFGAVETCDSDEKIAARGIRDFYRHSEEMSGCAVFWR